MKKGIILSLGLLLVCIGLTGCFKRDDLEDVTIYTTVYPIEYLTQRLYGYNSEVLSIYPNDVDTDSYELSDKQIKDYSAASVFIYNGLNNEKEIARTFRNKNKNLNIIDVSYGLKYTYGVEELWLSPNNYLMLASNIRSSLNELITSKYIKDEIDANFAVLEEDISLLDAELRSIASASTNDNQNTLLVASNVLQFLNNYGFETILLKTEDDMTSSLSNQLNSKKFKYILITDNDEQSDYLKEIIENNKLQVITINSLHVMTDNDRKTNENYITFMKAFLEQIRAVALEK